jgi:hypothetical protein
VFLLRQHIEVAGWTPASGCGLLLGRLSGDNEVGRRFASTNCYQEQLSLGNTAVSSPRAGA